MFQQQTASIAARTSTSRSQVPRLMITAPTQHDDKQHSCPAEYIGFIPATKRDVYRLSYDNGKYFRFRPTPDMLRDPFSHTVLNPRPPGGQCSIMHCEYCKLCAAYGIDPHAFQTNQVPEGVKSPKWDVYFHWIMNEQIPRHGQAGMGNSSRNYGHCWIESCSCHAESASNVDMSMANTTYLGCPCDKLERTWEKRHDKPYFFSCECNGKQPGSGNEGVYYINLGTNLPEFPFDICRNYSFRRACGTSHEKACIMCRVMKKLTESENLQCSFSLKEQKHNEEIYRNITFVLSPLAVDEEAEPDKGWKTWKDFFFNPPDEETLTAHERGRKEVHLSETHPDDGEGHALRRWKSPSRFPTQLGRGKHLRTLSHEDISDEYSSSSSSESGHGIMVLGSGSRLAMKQTRPSGRPDKESLRLRFMQAENPETSELISSASPVMFTVINSKSNLQFALGEAMGSEMASNQNTSPSSVDEVSTPRTDSFDALVIGSTSPSTLDHSTLGSSNDAETRQQEQDFHRWINIQEDGWNPRTPKKVILRDISIFKKIKILLGIAEDPNQCRDCSFCKTACLCAVQLADGTWMLCREVEDS